MPRFIPARIIKKKRDGLPLSSEEISFMMRGFLEGNIPPYQVSALLMAIYFRGMGMDETIALTREIIRSGSPLELRDLPGMKVDKHSTGGVGDKVSLILAPLVASADVYVPMVSGRALGHTGGTLDKLESIPGLRTDLSREEMVSQLKAIGIVMAGQTEEIAPLDRELYALRDVTATVESIPLIASSIMGKKLSEGIDGLVLDVKVGSGAFMKGYEDAEGLAKVIVEIGKGMGKEVVALITGMDQPLGRMIGNSLEVLEAIEVLRGDREGKEDLWEVTRELGAWMLIMGRKAETIEGGRDLMERLLLEGKGLERLRELVTHQGGRDVISDTSLLPVAEERMDVLSEEEGCIASMDTERIGWASVLLGCGRRFTDDRVDHGVGIRVHKKIGDPVERGEPVFTVYHRKGQDVGKVIEELRSSITCGEKVPSPPPVRGLIR